MANIHALQRGLKKQVTFTGLHLSELWGFVLTKVKSASPCGACLACKRDLPTPLSVVISQWMFLKKMPGCCYVTGKGQFSPYVLFNLINRCPC